ncbi:MULTISPECIES: phosphoethanolamine transferase [unclassified Pseudomonas]|uniref:phosphoethanolamine transferase n=1 Tax=unclassified Pseudomonas TaxID=196821 RepID=UPI000DA9D422|nr:MULTISPECIES: phosphoethanolamine--lipid A transferase [unclassified Pseudomonas]MDW3713291.1 phosphoethanolamine--lipid A transferase [Pseudomonas sp. 2023EL-01195]PZE12009.1 phosphoethanolamine transferase [Pseudomonas sp. 57B-090624]
MFKKISIRPELLAFLTSALFLSFYNFPLWKHIANIVPSDVGGMLMRIAFGVMVLAIFNFVLVLFSFRWVFKPLLITLFLASSGAAYFMSQYGVLIDANMLRNVMETDVNEVRGLLSLKFALFVVLLGILPSWLLWKLPVRHQKLGRELLGKLAIAIASLVVLGVVALANYQGLASLFRNHHELRLLVVPSNYLNASFGYVREQLAVAKAPLRPIATDAHKAPAWQSHQRKSLTVLVVGESARAKNFGILGYERDTTPALKSQPDVVAFANARSCGTETAVSVPCMFSNMGRSGYDAAQARSQEGLLDVLQRAGLAVTWRDNQSGCKGTCDRVALQDLSHEQDPALCNTDECHDGILLTGLQEYIDQMKDDSVIVLHQVGSHGPEYFKRYPKQFEKFSPVCTSNALNNCSQESIINAYDNTLVYTDYLLSSLIDLLNRNQDRFDTAMIYLSDHGESLGEYNLFLHGTPYLLAPDQQKHVPLLTWFSKSYQQDFGLDLECLRMERDKALSHDNLFHSVLGLLQIQTSEYRGGLDMFSACRGTTTNTSVAIE